MCQKSGEALCAEPQSSAIALAVVELREKE